MQQTPPDPPPLLGASPPFLDLMEAISRVAPVDRPVLVVGERGTGKELVAARLHGLSRRWGQAMVAVNCAALPESLLESELFGHEAGAFTGAARRRPGRFERAHGGTLFLDEIATASLTVQEKVLRVVEYGTYERLGGGETLRCDTRLIAAANEDLPAAAAAGRFRHDLLDRLAFDVLTVPPLRARRGDIGLLADAFGRTMAVALEWPGFPGFSSQALSVMRGHDWPGNVRELRNVVERAVHRWPDPASPIAHVDLDPFDSPYRPEALGQGAGQRIAAAEREPAALAAPERKGAKREAPSELEKSLLPHEAFVLSLTPPQTAYPLDLESEVTYFEKTIIEQALETNHFNKRATAKHLGLTYGQLRGKLVKHRLPARPLGDPILG